MRIYIIIPAHNEEYLISETLNSLTKQTFLPQKIVVVNDNSTDNTERIVQEFVDSHSYISLININSSVNHMPGSKVINAFYEGYKVLDNEYDVICKFDADLIFPENYLQTIIETFDATPKIGMASGILHIKKGQQWVYEHIADKNHIRGPIKAYRKECFEDIDGLKKSIGWDTLDVLLAEYHGWNTITHHNLLVKHLKPTGKSYHKNSKYLQGEAMYKMRYGFWITVIASIKLTIIKKQPFLIFNYLKGYYNAQRNNIPFLVSASEGVYIRKLRWQKIKKKLF